MHTIAADVTNPGLFLRTTGSGSWHNSAAAPYQAHSLRLASAVLATGHSKFNGPAFKGLNSRT